MIWKNVKEVNPREKDAGYAIRTAREETRRDVKDSKKFSKGGGGGSQGGPT